MSEVRTLQTIRPELPETAALLQENTEQLGAYLVQMAQLMSVIQRRLDEMEEKQRKVTLSHEEVKGIRLLIGQKAADYCGKYQLTEKWCRMMIATGIRKSILARYGVKDLHDVPAIARQAVETQVAHWADSRLMMKCREKMQRGGA